MSLQMARNAWSRPAAATLAIVLCAAVPAAAQRVPFVDALVDFQSALFGTYGDEGAAVTAALDRMTAALDAWEGEQRAATSGPGRPPTPADRALLHAEHLQLESAVAAMRAAIDAEPSRAPLYVYVGRLHDALGQRADAAVAFETARALDPSDPVAAYLVGQDLIARAAGRSAGESGLAPVIATLTEAADRGASPPVVPHFPLIEDMAAPARVFAPPAYEEGFALISRRQFRQAMDAFRAAAARDPLVSDAASRSEGFRRGVAALRAKNGAAAIEHLEAVVRAYPDSSEARRVLGVTYRAARRLPEAIASFEAAVTRAPADERARVALGSTLHEAGRLEEAARVLRDTIDVLPSSGEARWALAPVYEDLLRATDAIATLNDSTALNVVAGKSHLYWRIAQLVHLYHRDHARVIDVLTRRARLIPNEPHAHKDLGLAYNRAGRDDEAMVELLMATLLGLDEAETLTVIGQIHLRQERLARAEASLARAVRLDPAFSEARYALAQTLRRLGRTTEATEHFAVFEKLRQAAFDEQRRTHERETAPVDAVPARRP